jgi:hypothetical protein
MSCSRCDNWRHDYEELWSKYDRLRKEYSKKCLELSSAEYKIEREIKPLVKERNRQYDVDVTDAYGKWQKEVIGDYSTGVCNNDAWVITPAGLKRLLTDYPDIHQKYADLE